MERIKQILEEKLNTDLLQIVLSDPRKKPETFGNAQGMEKDKALLASKVKIRPVQKKDRLFFQMTSYVGTQVFHTNYEKEELIAEIGASALMNAAGLETPNSFRNSAAYIQNWLRVLKNDKRFIVSASGKAEKAVQMILNQ